MWHLCVALQQCTTVLPTDKRVMARMKELAAVGVRRVPEMQRHIKSFVCDLFAGSAVPPTTDARFWPSGQTVLNCIYRTTKLTRFVNSMHYFSLGYCVVNHGHPLCSIRRGCSKWSYLLRAHCFILRLIHVVHRLWLTCMAVLLLFYSCLWNSCWSWRKLAVLSMLTSWRLCTPCWRK